MCNFRIEYFICSMFIYYILYYSPLIKKKTIARGGREFSKRFAAYFPPFSVRRRATVQKKKNNNSPSMSGKGNYQ